MKIWILQTGEPIHIDKGPYKFMRAVNLSNHLVNRGHEVVLWSSAFFHQGKYHRSKSYSCIQINNNLEIRLIPSCGYKKNIGLARLFDHFQLGWNLKKLLKKENTEPDIAFIGYPPIETAAVMSKWLLKRNIPTIIDIKDLWPEIYVHFFPKIFQFIIKIILFPYFYLAKRAINDATGVSSPSQSFLNKVLDFASKDKTQNDKVFFLTSPKIKISKKIFLLAQKWFVSQDFDKTKNRVLFAGAFMSVMDFKPILTAAKQLPNIEFVLCGQGYNFKKIKIMTKGLDNVIFPGNVDRAKLQILAKISIASLLPYKKIDNYNLNIPNKVIDYLFFGLPLLSPLEGEVQFLINRHKIGFTYDENNTLSNCIRTLVDNNQLRKQMSINAKRLYAQKFEYHSVYDSFADHLELLAIKKNNCINLKLS
jgi:glycosyltransferase involved in cell wall biosynthesis